MVLFTGLTSAGKSTVARAVHRQLTAAGLRAEILDGDDMRATLWPDLTFSQEDREENLRRLGFVAVLLARNGVVALVSAIAPFQQSRAAMREACGSFLEVFVDAPPAVCEQRDRSGLYRRFRAGEVKGLSGFDEPYEVPRDPDVLCRTEEESVDQSATRVFWAIRERIAPQYQHVRSF